MMNVCDVHDCVIEKDYFIELDKKRGFNEYLRDFYVRMSEEYGDEKFLKKADGLIDCCKYLNVDYYRKNECKHVLKINRCKDAFCYNCQQFNAERRFQLYAPVLAEYEKDYDVYHVIFTQPNVDGAHLKNTLTLMFDRISYMIRYFDGRSKIRGIDFSQYGYAGAVRSLEITTKEAGERTMYHPHFHCMFILKKGLNMESKYWNRYSYDPRGNKPPYPFTSFEILLQRIWCLLIMRKPVTKNNINHIGEVLPQYPDGFSVRAGHVTDGNYHEIFKYAIKGTYQEKSIFTYETFVTLYFALYNRKVYQTYGCLYNLDFNVIDDVVSPTLTTDVLFELIIERLQSMEMPVNLEEELDEIIKSFYNGSKIRYIGATSLCHAFAHLSEEDKREKIEKLLDFIRRTEPEQRRQGDGLF